MDNGQPPLFLPPHFSQFTPPLFSGMKGTYLIETVKKNTKRDEFSISVDCFRSHHVRIEQIYLNI